MGQCEAGSRNVEYASSLRGKEEAELERRMEPDGEGLESYARGLQTTLPGGLGIVFPNHRSRIMSSP